MLLELIIALSLSPSLAQQQEEEEPLPEPVMAALEDLDKSFRSRLDFAIIASIGRAKEVDHPEVVARIAGVLDHRKPAVRRTAVGALAEMELDEARLALEQYWRTGKRLAIDPDLADRTLRAIGRHGHADSFEIFSDVAWMREDGEPVPIELLRTKVRGLARIREPRSVDRLVELFVEVPVERHEDLRLDFRLALLVLTGEDSDSITWWQRWLERLPEDYGVPEGLPDLATADRLDWLTYWGLPPEAEMDEDLRDRRERHRGRR